MPGLFNRINNHSAKLLGVALVLGVISFSGCMAPTGPTSGQAPGAATGLVPESLTASQVKSLFSESVGQGKPAVIDFSSRFCYECRQLRPKLEALEKQFPNIAFEMVNIQSKEAQDKKRLDAFKVITVPYVAFVDASGNVKQVIAEDVSPEVLTKAAHSIELQSQTQPPPAQANSAKPACEGKAC